jgi:hypothetical protein
MIDENTALCKIVCKATRSIGKENECKQIVEKFAEHKDFNKTMEELTNILGKSKDEIMYIIANSCVPCTQGES